MTIRVLLLVLALGGGSVAQTGGVLRPDPPMVCASCDEWNGAREPFRIFGNSYFVGTQGLSAILITSDAGHVLLDGGLAQSAALIDRNIRRLGLRTEDIRLIVNSHAHYDHAGGIAALQRVSGAEVAASAWGVRVIERGEPTADDPQYGFGRAANAFPAVAKVRSVADGETLRVGSIAISAHLTPGHTPGSTTWSWRSCDGPRCLNLVYADSLNPVSSDEFRFTGSAGSPSRIESFRRSIQTVDALPCDIVIAVHPSFSGLDQKLAARARQPKPPVGADDPLIDPQGCRSYAADARARLERRIADERR
jgi:metallo-beta-lactamase class B